MLNVEPVNLSDAEFKRIRALAARLAGITIAPTKKALVVGRWGRRLTHHGFESYSAYLDLLESGQAGDELQISLDLLTTNETNFFREPKHFDFLRNDVLPKRSRGNPFRVWSAACSSGEEPYSIAMLLAAQLPHANWDLLATDISSRVLEAAAGGLYDASRARQIPPDYLRRFCLKGTGPQAGKILLDRELMQRVQFHRVNLNEPLPALGEFDVILVRNVMIYFDTPTKSRIIERILRQLRPGGHLLIGHCDTLQGVPHGLINIQASVYRKPGA
jgi:chemotaxis protein methyltransferase CheR